MSGWSSSEDYKNFDRKCQSYEVKIKQLEDKVDILEKELRDTHKKISSKLSFLLKRIQDLEEKSLN